LVLLNYGFYKCIQKTLISNNNNTNPIYNSYNDVNELEIINNGSLDIMIKEFKNISHNIRETISLFQSKSTM